MRTLLVFLLLAGAGGADEVLVADGRKLVGRITEAGDDEVTVLTYRDGPVTVRARDVRKSTKGANLYDEYDAKAKDASDTADGHFELGNWCKGKGLVWQARIEWRKATQLNAEHEAARKALGDKKGKDGWTAFEDVQKAAGLECFEGKWLKPDAIARIKRARCPSHGWVLTAAYKDDADRAFLESWAGRAKEASKFMWELTEGQMYVEQITVTDKGGPADFTIINKDSMKIRQGVYAEAGADTITAPGQILAYTFFHELIHFKYSRPDHCDKCRHCIMSSDPTANQICDDADHKAPPAASCWGQMRKHHKELALLPLTRKWKPTKAPETQVVVKDR
jgi:hypothetical protein